jgi:hypothetical protein
MCDALEEMRQCHKTRNYAPMLGLIEEVQSMANRMEAGLGEKHDYERWRKRVKSEKQKLKQLLKKTNKLRKKQGKDKEKMPEYP